MISNILLLPSIIDIICTSIFIYILYFFFRGTYTATIAKGLLFAITVYIIAEFLHLNIIRWIFKRFFNDFPILMAILFHQELRRFLSNLGRTHEKQHVSSFFRNELKSSLISISEKKLGALIIIEHNMTLDEYFSNGVTIDSKFNAILVETIFYKGSPLHDGALIVRKEHIIASQVFLPITISPKLMGARHSAGVSITKERDCIAFIVSEENGTISYAKEGALFKISKANIEETIHEILG